MNPDFDPPTDRALYPSVFKRYFGSFIDGLLIFAAATLVASSMSDIGVGTKGTQILVFVFLILFLEPILTSSLATPGQFLFGYRVRRLNQGTHWNIRPTKIEGKIGIFRALFRYLVKIILGFYSLLTIPASKGYRAVHDKMSGTIVVNTNWESIGPYNKSLKQGPIGRDAQKTRAP